MLQTISSGKAKFEAIIILVISNVYQTLGNSKKATHYKITHGMVKTLQV